MVNKYIVLVLLVVWGIGCESPTSYSEELQLSIQPRLERSGEYYTLEVDTTKWQTVHRIDGVFSQPIEFKRVEWMSNLYWYHNTEPVPTVQDRSISNEDGKISIMIGVTRNMIGDTLLLRYHYDNKPYSDTINDYVPNTRNNITILLQ